MSAEQIAAFWELARRHARFNPLPGYFGETPLDVLQPPAWSFGATPQQADELGALVVNGTKTATAAALWDYQAAAEPLPEVGTMGIITDSAGEPLALIVTTRVDVVPFDQVDADHAWAEGEGDRSLQHWREVHQWFFTEYAEHDRGFSPQMPVVLERFEVLYPRSH